MSGSACANAPLVSVAAVCENWHTCEALCKVTICDVRHADALMMFRRKKARRPGGGRGGWWSWRFGSIAPQLQSGLRQYYGLKVAVLFPLSVLNAVLYPLAALFATGNP